MNRLLRAMIAGVAFSVAGAPVAVPAATLYVANDGFDEPGCGRKVAPCRSISAAIKHASPYDRIEVGPGAYGDLNEDGLFGGAGDEDAEIGLDTCNCLLKIDKPLTITSTLGAGSTLIKVGDTFFNGLEIVRIQSDDVVFGRKTTAFILPVHEPLRRLSAAASRLTKMQGGRGLKVISLRL
jgi:hypothetical protein